MESRGGAGTTGKSYRELGATETKIRRKYKENHIDFEIRFDSIYTPSLEGKQLLLVDPMLATGGCFVVGYHELLNQGG